MCGRFQLTCTFSELVALYGLARTTIDPGIVPRRNVAPTQQVPIIRVEDGERVGVEMRWGYPATWLARQGKDPWSRALINAQAEEAAAKPTWAKSLRTRRCLVPATGFYEWARKGKQRLPILFSRTDGAPLGLAGVHASFDRDGQATACFAILTAGPGPELGRFHDRGPVVVEAADWDRWLSPDLDGEEIAALLRPAGDGVLGYRPVSTAVNDARNGQPDLAPDWALSDLD